MTQNYDVIIVGAGPSGSTTAHYLAKKGISVLLLDKSDFPRDKTCGDGLPPRALPILQDMELLEEVMKVGCQLDVLAVTSPAGKTAIIPIPRLPHAPSHAVIIPRFILDNLICQRAIKSGAHFQGGVHVSNIEATDDGISVKTQTGKSSTHEYKAQMAVVATGATTRLLSNMGLFNEVPPTIVAARAYFENISNLEKRFHFCFSGVAMPGYGWIFPTSDTSANIGTGFIVNINKGKQPSSPRAAFDVFITNHIIKDIIRGAEQVGPIKGYPLRTDFARASTYGKRVLLVGESAGLVNPLTGDGIDYALESGKIASKHLITMFETSDFSEDKLKFYDDDLRAHYQNLFVFCERIQHYCLNRAALNSLVPAARWFPKLAELLVLTVLGGKEVPEKISPLKLIGDVVTHL